MIRTSKKDQPMTHLPASLEPIDLRITDWCARLAILLLRLSVGICFLWFGALKLFPGLSPAEALATKTIVALSWGMIPAAVIPLGLGIWECLIGLGMITGLWIRATLLLLAVQLPGTITPLFLFPHECFVQFPLVPTLEGQYIIKNLVLAAAALAVAATVRGGRLVPGPPKV
ncbi:hypothetical protein LBMAG53_39690 [Planctomycetota bacterium]|nr:hypothetical protein LBMAG53_39690 [Planctomycetota bacterium]